MMKVLREKGYVILFTLAVTVFYGTLVSGLNMMLEERTAQNRQFARQKVLLQLAGAIGPAREVTPEEAGEMFPAALVEKRSGDYLYYVVKGDPDRVIFPVAGRGFWDMIRGWLVVDTKSKTIQGIDFTEHSETPGLGARITEDWFKEQFVGKPYDRVDAQGVRLQVVTRAEKPTEVDAITGATETSRAVQRLLTDSIDRFIEETGQ